VGDMNGRTGRKIGDTVVGNFGKMWLTATVKD
jgi:hypothetical protein